MWTVQPNARGRVCALSAVILISSVGFLSGCSGFVNANGAPPNAAIQVIPASVSFGSGVVGKKVSQTISVANTGNTSVNISRANLTNSQFSVSGLAIPFSLPAGQSSSFQVSFVPNAS